MARKKTSGAEDFMDLVARLPWWGGVLMAMVTYLIFHTLAGQKVVASSNPAEIGSVVIKTVVTSVSGILQYVAPLLCLFGAAGSALRRRERSALLSKAAQGHTASIVDGMSWRQFELLVGEALRQQGYRVLETGGGGADGGVDLILTKDGETFLVQCKQWRAYKVGVAVVRELFGVMAAKGATGGYLVTSGRFTAEASDFARGRNVTLVDGTELAKWIKAARTTSTASTSRPNNPVAFGPISANRSEPTFRSNTDASTEVAPQI